MKKFNPNLIIFFTYFIVTSISPSTIASANSIGKSSTNQVLVEKALLAGGCFWCMEHPFEDFPGISESISGYTGGKKKNATYKKVASGETRHVEAVEIHFDPSMISYNDILEIFWRNIDPTDAGGQFIDRGNQYTTGIFFQNLEQKKIAEQSIKKMERNNRFGKKILTRLEKAGPFYKAEKYHQDFFKKNYIRYKIYRAGSGRDRYINQIWGDDREYKVLRRKSNTHMLPPVALISNKRKLKSKLTKLQYYVTQKNGTEPPFNNKYWDSKKSGIYVDIVSGEPLFSSKDKFKSGTGWPSFTRPLVRENIVEAKDTNFGMIRIEIRSKKADSHLGHLFRDGPKPTGLRYCINSASLRFVEVADLEKEGYGEYKGLFNNKKGL